MACMFLESRAEIVRTFGDLLGHAAGMLEHLLHSIHTMLACLDRRAFCTPEWALCPMHRSAHVLDVPDK